MKLIIAGSRTINEKYTGLISNALAHFDIHKNPTEILCGLAKGADTLGENWANENHIIIAYFPADWEMHGKSAGPIRNKEMAIHGDALLLIWDGESKGSASMKREMKKQGKLIYEVILKTT